MRLAFFPTRQATANPFPFPIPLKTPLLILLFLKFLCCGLALGRDEAALAAFEERVKTANPKEASEIVTEAMAAQDHDRLEICLLHRRTANFVVALYANEAPSPFKDKLTTDLINLPWEPAAASTDSERPRAPGGQENLKPYLDYMGQRLGEHATDLGSTEEFLASNPSPESRKAITRKFEKALVKAGLAEAKPEAPTRPRKNWVPGKDGDSAKDGDPAGSTTPWIVGAAVLLVAVGGFFIFKKKGA